MTRPKMPINRNNFCINIADDTPIPRFLTERIGQFADKIFCSIKFADGQQSGGAAGPPGPPPDTSLPDALQQVLC